jgi:hypothetical protein
MFDDSDTESEPESSLPKCTATDFAHAHKAREHENPKGLNFAQNAIAAIRTLDTLDLSVIQKV